MTFCRQSTVFVARASTLILPREYTGEGTEGSTTSLVIDGQKEFNEVSARVCKSFKVLVGLEIHVQLATQTKMFTAAANGATNFGASPNSLVDPVILGLPGVLWKLIALALIWAYLHHFIAGLRHLWMDTHHDAVSKEFGSSSAKLTLALSIGLTLVLGAKLFGIY